MPARAAERRPPAEPAPPTPAPPRRAHPRAVHLEVIGSLVALLGIFVFVCLAFGNGEAARVGAVGVAIEHGAAFLVGRPLSFVLPAAVVWLGVSIFRGRMAHWSPSRVAGIVLGIAAVAGMLAVPAADDVTMREVAMWRAGALGAFLVEWDGLRLVGQFGTLGATMILAGMMLVGLVLTTGRSVSSLIAIMARRPRTAPAAHETIGSEDETPIPISAAAAQAAIAGPPPVLAHAHSRSTVESRDGLIVRVFRGWGMGRRREAPAAAPRSGILSGIDDAAGWDEPADNDVAAAARALEVHEWEKRIHSRLKVRHDRAGAHFDADIEEPEAQEEIETLDDSDEVEQLEMLGNEEEAEEDEEAASDEQEEGEESAEAEEEEAEEAEGEDGIVFTDNTAPLAIAKGNPANVGDGLAKLFPSRWPKAGTPASKETAQEVIEKSEARHLRQVEAKLAQQSREPREDDPLFNVDFDTRPFGPNGSSHAASAAAAPQEPVEPEIYRMPDIQMLEDPPQVDARMTREEMLEMSTELSQTLTDFGIEGKVVQVHQGPVVTRFEYRPAAGIKVSRITGLEHDIAMGMKALSVRILAPIPGKNTVGIEVPNKKRQGVYLKELISCEEFWDHKSPLAVCLGKTIDGTPYFADLARMPHLLIAGATGAGKSVCLNTIICSLLYRNTPDQVKMIMVDPKRVELSVYRDIPHLIAPVVCEPKRAASALEWAVEEMESRYERLVQFGVRNIDGYNRLAHDPNLSAKTAGRSIEPLPYLVVIVDELADLMIVAKAEVEESIQRLAQMARAVGIHLILATQRPSVNVITGIIKANFPSRIAFQVAQKVDSRTILDTNGAEALLGRGDMLLSSGGAAKPIRVQGAFLSDEEVERIAEHCRTQRQVRYVVEEFEPKLSEKEQKELAKMMGVTDMSDLDAQEKLTRGTNKVMGKVTAGMFVPHQGGSASAGDEEIDEALVRAAARLILETRKASVSLLQRRLKVGFARAGRLMDMLEEMGIVGKFMGSKPRDIIVDPEAALEQLDILEATLAEGLSVEDLEKRKVAVYEEEEEEEVEEEEDGEEAEYEEEEEEYEDEEEEETRRR